MRVLGIDPGFGRVGLGCVDGTIGKLTLVASTCVETSASTSFDRRLLQIFEDITTFITECEPDIVSIEKLFFATNRTTAMQVSEARGVILLAVAKQGLPYAEYSPPQIKVAVTGYGEASKQQVAAMVSRLIAKQSVISQGPDDVTDAVAIAICHHHSHPLASKVLQAQRNTQGIGQKRAPLP